MVNCVPVCQAAQERYLKVIPVCATRFMVVQTSQGPTICTMYATANIITTLYDTWPTLAINEWIKYLHHSLNLKLKVDTVSL